MGKIALLLRDLPADKRTRSLIRALLTHEQWSDILEADARGVSANAMFAALSGTVVPFFRDPKQFANAIAAERLARKKAAKK